MMSIYCMSCAGLQGALKARSSGVAVRSTRSIWWGHDTLEEQMDRKQRSTEKDVISWSKPGAVPEKKEEYSWVPARIKAEAALANPSFFAKWTGAVDTAAYFSKYKWRPAIFTSLFDPEKYMEESQQRGYARLVISQEFVKERLLALGPDLAAAHFLCHRGCRVRFRGHQHWTEMMDGELDIPDTYMKGWYIEAIDAKQSNLVYEGLQNLRNLHHIKYLDVSYCDFMDVWCMDRISGEYADTLEYLDISGNRQMNWNSLEVLWRFKNLKTLVLKDMDHVEDLSLICLMLLDILPKLKIIGAEYLDLKLLEGTKHQHLLNADFIPKLPSGEGEDQPSSQAKEARV
jgi:hypothetical protein